MVLMRIEQFRYNGANYEQTKGVSALLPEDKIIELYNLGKETRKPTEIVQLHQTYFGAPVISITFAQPAKDDNGRDTTQNHTFLISLKEVTKQLLYILRFYAYNDEKLETLEIAGFTLSAKTDS